MRSEVSYLELAKAAKAAGNDRMIKLLLKQQKRVNDKKRRLREQPNAR